MRNNRKRTASLKPEDFDTNVEKQTLGYNQKRAKVDVEDGIDNCMNDLLDKSKQLDVNVDRNSCEVDRNEASMSKMEKGNFGAKLYKSGKLVCYDCKQTFFTKSDYDFHIATEHDRIDQTPLQERIKATEIKMYRQNQDTYNLLKDEISENVENSQSNEIENTIASYTSEDPDKNVVQLMREKIGESVSAIQIDVNKVFHLAKKDMKKKDEELKNVTEENKVLIKAVAEAKNMLNIKDATIMKKDEQVKSMRESLNDAKEMLIMKKKDEELKILIEEKKDLNKALAEAKNVLYIKVATIAKKDEQIESMKESLSAAKQMLIQKVTSASKNIEVHVKRNEELLKENKKFKEEVQQMDELETENVLLKENLRLKEEKLESAELEIKKLNQELDQKVKDQQSKNMEVSEKIKSKEKVIEILEKENEELKKKCNKRKLKLKKAQKFLKSVEKRLWKTNGTSDFRQKLEENFKMREVPDMDASNGDSTKSINEGKLKVTDINDKVMVMNEDGISNQSTFDDEAVPFTDSEQNMEKENVEKMESEDMMNKDKLKDTFKPTTTEDDLTDQEINFEESESSKGQHIKTEKNDFEECSTSLLEIQSQKSSASNLKINTESDMEERMEDNSSQNGQNDETEIWNFKAAVTETVKECLLKYYNSEVREQQTYIIKEKEDFIELCKMFSYRFRKEVKDSFVEFNGTWKGICLTTDDKEFIKDQIEQYFKFHPLKKPGRRSADLDL